MPKVSFRMASASRDSVFRRTDQHGAENLSVRPHRGPVDHRAKRMLRTEGNPQRYTWRQAEPADHATSQAGASSAAGETPASRAEARVRGVSLDAPPPAHITERGLRHTARRPPAEHPASPGGVP